jgi:membrane protein YdbS with pleckstrin-like domain
MQNNVITVRGLWLAVILLTGLVAAVLAAAAFWLVKADPAAVFTAGGATFLGVSSLGMAMRRFLTGTAD